jgi:DNA-binding response OmpR family regulator
MNKSTNVVLVIDDEPKIRRFIRSGFEHHGFSVLDAETVADGLKAAKLDAPDLVILDLNLPGLHGAEVLKELRSWSNVPVIILSVVSDQHEKVRLLESGADDYVVKPFGMAELVALGLWVFQSAGPLVRDRRRLEVVRKSLRPAASTRSQTARCSPRRSHWPRAGSSCPTFP